MKRLTYRLEDQYGNPTDSIILESDLLSLNSSEKWKKVLSRLAAIEDILGDEYDLERMKELIQADRERRVLPEGSGWFVTCSGKKLTIVADIEAALRREQE